MKFNPFTLTAVAGAIIAGAANVAASEAKRNLRQNGEEGRVLGVNKAKNVFKVPKGNDKPKGNVFGGGNGGGGDGRDDGVAPEIVGGIEVDPRRKYGFFVSLGGCGASLIAPNLVLSAAHCAGINPVSVALGTHQQTVDGESEFAEVEHIPVINSWPHPQYNDNTLDYDFWVIELQWSTQKYASEVVAIDDGIALSANDPVTVMGFGTLVYQGSSPNNLFEVTVPYVETTPLGSCAYGSYPNGDITDRMLCAGQPGKDACQGDSGGPLIDDRTGKQVGVVSWGYGCADPEYPGIYSRVSNQYDWINGYITTYGDANIAPPTQTCWGSPSGWYDADGPQYSCTWYGQGNRCGQYGGSFANGGIVANEACCECGGGTSVAPPPASPTQPPAPTTGSPTSAPVTASPVTSSPTKPPVTSSPTQSPVTPSPVAQCLPSKDPSFTACNASTNCCSGVGNCFQNGGKRGQCK